MLAVTDLMISEFMAINDTGLQDGDLDTPDWIEVYNSGSTAESLSGLKLKDDNATWEFPQPEDIETVPDEYDELLTLDPDEYIVVMASDKGDPDHEPQYTNANGYYVDSADYLHTNFKLKGSGEYLGLLTAADLVIHEYDEYPRQWADISYGIAQDIQTTEFVGSGDTASYLVPTGAVSGWTGTSFDDSGWSTGPTALGFSDTVPGFAVFNYKANVLIGNLSVAEDVIATAGMQTAVYSENAAVINYLNSGGSGHYAAGEVDFPGFTSDREDFAVEATAVVTIPSAGEWTFGVNSDDGFGLDLDNGTDTFRIEHFDPRGPGDTLGTFNFTQVGPCQLRLVYFERGGGAEVELFAAQGNYATFDGAAFDLVGDTANGGLEVYSEPVVGGGGTAFVDLIKTDVEDVMKDVNASMFLRHTFTLDSQALAAIDSLTLKMKYDDGYVAYLNGVEIYRQNAPGTPRWDSNATAERTDAQAVIWENVDVSAFISDLVVGDNVLAIHALNYATGDGDFLVLPELDEIEYLGLGEHYFAIATPNDVNSEEYWAYVEDTWFDVDRGFYETAFDLTIGSDTLGATLVYTLDGSAPTLTNGTQVWLGEDLPPAGTITISTTSIVRAAAFKTGFEPTNIDTQTYIFLDDIIDQPSDPAGFPTLWRTEPADYEMNPAITGDPAYAAGLKDDLLSLPTMSLGMDQDDLFGYDTGIYSNPNNQGLGWERAGSLEYFDPNTGDEFQEDAGVRMYGGVGRNPGYKKHSFRLLFKADYGATKLDFPLFGEEAVDEFDTIILRSNFNDAWVWGGARTQFVRDEFAGRLQNAMGDAGRHGNFVHLYVNGLYWGLYNPVERPDTSFSASYYGGDKENWDGINSGQPTGESQTAAWNTLMSMSTNLTTNEGYQQVQGNNVDGTNNPAYEDYLDIDNYINYLLVNQWAGNNDWVSHNWYAGRLRGPDSTGFKSYSWDAEWIVNMNSGLGDNTVNDTTTSNYLLKPYNYLRGNAEFRMRYADHVHRHFFNGGVLTADYTLALYQSLVDQIEKAVVTEAARWGDVAGDYDPQDWSNERDYLLNTYLPQRSGIVLQQLKDAGLYPNLEAPSFHIDGLDQHGGTVPLDAELTIDGPGTGTIYYTTNGSDPRELYGAVNPAALTFDPMTDSITLTEGVHVKSRVYDNGTWSALNEASFYIDLAPDIRITEIMYNPADPDAAEIAAGHTDADDFEFVEIKNIGTQTLPLEGLRFSNGIEFTFSQKWIAPGEYVVVVSNQAAFLHRYPGYSGQIAGEYGSGLPNGTQLSNAGERLELDAPVGGVIHDFKFKDGWYGHTDGDGFSLTVRDPLQDPSLWALGEGWRASAAPGGTPGYDDTLVTPGSVIVNEALAHTDGYPNDVIELLNTTESPIDISNWFLSDQKTDELGNSTLQKYEIAPGTTIGVGASAYLVLTEDDNFGAGSGDPGSAEAFSLSEFGDDVYLSSNAGGVAGGYREHVDFGTSPNNVAIGLYTKSTGNTDFTLLSAHSFGSANAYPLIDELVINEIQYHPADPSAAETAAGYDNDDDFEFLELYNRSGSAIDLRNYYLGAGIGFSFGWYNADDFGNESRTLEPGATATWTTSSLANDTYEVFARWDLLDAQLEERSLDGQARYLITHAAGSTEVIRDQKPELDDEGPDYMDEFGWVSLGVYTFNGSGTVQLTRGTNNPGNWTIADQVKFVKSGSPDVVVDDPTLDSWFTTNGTASLAPDDYVVIVRNYAAFDYRYDIAGNGINAAGQYTGSLDNNGEKVKLMRIGQPEANGYLPYYRADYVNYNDISPWPLEPDGNGNALNRLRGASELYGNDPAHWGVSTYLGTPGAVNAAIDPTPPQAPTNVAAAVALVPGTQIELTWTAAVEPNSYVDHYVIYRNDEQIGTSETTVYTDTEVSPAVPYSYEISAVNRDQYESARSAAEDITIPGLDDYAIPNTTTLELMFTEPLEQVSAELLTNYTFVGGTLSSAVLQGDNVTVALTTSTLVQGQAYTLTVAGLDTVSGLLMPAGQQVAFEYYPNGSGNILREYWTDIGGTAVPDLTNNANYPDNPDRRNFPTLFEGPVNWAESYGTRMRGYVHPPTSGYYTFWIASDDNSQLYLSTDGDPANKIQIASVPTWTGSRNWYTHAAQQSAEIYLAAGQRYYLEALQKEGGGGDNLAVAWQRTGGAFQGPIPGAYLSPYEIAGLDNTPPEAPGNVLATPVNSVQIDLTWDAAVDAETGVSYYVVYRNGVEISATTALSYTDVGLDQTQTYSYSVAAVNGDDFQGDAGSAAAMPLLGVASAAPQSPAEILVTFGKAVTEATAEIVANYTVTDIGGQIVAVSSATWDPGNSDEVTLTLGGTLAEGALYTVAVSGVEDTSGKPAEPGAAAQFFYGTLDPDLLSWWTFDVDGHTISHDLTGNNRFLDVFGADWTASGRIGGAYQFDGTAGDYLFDEEAESYINGLSGFTFAAWINADSLATDSGLYSLRTPNNDERYGFRHDAQLQNQNNQPNGFRGGVRTTGGDQHWESLPDTQSTDWQHFAVTWESGQDIKVYLDGVPQTPGWIQAAVTGTITGSERLFIGRGTKDGASSFAGLMDDVRIYGDALAQAEVNALIDSKPVAQDDVYEAVESATLNVVGSGVLSNDFDPDPGPAALSAVLEADVSHGTLNLNSDGSFDYTPTPGYTGPDSFTYRAYDGADYSSLATVDLTVQDAVRILSGEATDNTHLEVLFSTDLDQTSAETTANYAVDGGISVTSASLGGDLRTVTLVLSPAVNDNQQYTLTVNNVQDQSLQYTIASDTQVTFEHITWLGQDIGPVAAAGSHSEIDGTWTIQGSGDDIWNNDDEFHFVYQPIGGDVTVTARVASMTNTNGWAKAGVMIRETLDATSTHAMSVVTPGSGVSFQRRRVTGQQSYHTTNGGLSAPYWVRIQREGNAFHSYRSPDGVTWTLVGTDTITMTQPTVYVGLAVTSHNDGALCEAVIDNVSIVGADTEAPTADITDVTPDPRSTPIEQIEIVFSEPVTGLDLGELTLTRDGGADLLTGAESLSTNDNVTWTLGGLTGLTTPSGTYTLTLTAAGSGIQDAAGNLLAADASDTWVTDVTGPTADITDVTPDPRNSAVNQIEIVFSEAVTGFGIEDLGLTRDGGDDLLGGQSLTTGDNVTWTLSGLSSLTAAGGTYTLTLTAAGSNIQNSSSLPLTLDASDTWVTDVQTPTADVTDVDPDPRDTGVDQVEIVFSEAVTGFDLEDLTLTRDGGANLLTGTEPLTTSDNVTWTLGGLDTLTGGGSGGFVAFNDHVVGGGTHANTTTYAGNGTSAGLLKDVSTGVDTGVTLTITQSGVSYARNGAAPVNGTDAYDIFNGYVDFTASTGSSLEISGADHYTHTFTGLDTGNSATYNFAGTAIRGNSSYLNRWTLVTLQGAIASTPSHSSGLGVVVVSPTQVAIWTGHNSSADQGLVAAWTDIDPGIDGEFAVASMQYTGTTPGVGGGTANGSKGYGIAGIRLEEVASSGIPGTYSLTLNASGSGITDAVGNPLGADASDTWVIQGNDPPTVDITDVAPDPRNTPVSDMEIVFSEAVTGLGMEDLRLTRDGSGDLLGAGQSVTTTDNVIWTLSGLSGLTGASGTYTLMLTATGSEIIDGLGNALAGDASESWTTDTDLPTVVDVLVASTQWHADFKGEIINQSLGDSDGFYRIPVGDGHQLYPLPWSEIDQIRVVFSEDVNVDTVTLADMVLTGVANPQVWPDSVAETPGASGTEIVTWTFENLAIRNDKLYINLDDSIDSATTGLTLDGDWDNPTDRNDPVSDTYPSGDGVAGADFNFRFNILVADANQSERVSGPDLLMVRNAYNSTPPGPPYTVFADFDGSGRVSGSDLLELRSMYNVGLVGGNPLPFPFPPAAHVAAAESRSWDFAYAADLLAAASRVQRSDDRISIVHRLDDVAPASKLKPLPAHVLATDAAFKECGRGGRVEAGNVLAREPNRVDLQDGDWLTGVARDRLAKQITTAEGWEVCRSSESRDSPCQP